MLVLAGKTGPFGEVSPAMGKAYRDYQPDQMFLMPPSLRDWLPEGHLAFFVSDAVDQLDISDIQNEYEKELRGYPPYHPRIC